MKWIIGIVVLAVIGFFGFQFLNGKNSGDVTDAATGAVSTISASTSEAIAKAQDAMPVGVDLSAITGNLEGVFSSTGEALGGITDAASATAAVPALEAAGTKLTGLSDTIARLPDAAKGPIGSVVSSGVAALEPAMNKVMAIPGVGDILDPVFLPMLEMLNGLAE